MRSAWWIATFLFLLLACAPNPKRVTLVVDGQRRVLETQAATVDAALQEQKVTLGSSDRVEPPSYTPLERNTVITVVRVEIRSETTTQPVPFERQIIRDENAAEGTTRVLQLGANGTVRITYQLISEDGKLTTRREVSRTVVTAPNAEILSVGTQGSLKPVAIQGTLIYLANGNAWVIRNRSDDKRPLVTTGDLDGRAFDLSPGGVWALFTRADTPDLLNALWFVNTVVLSDKPQRLPLQDVLYAQWRRASGPPAIAYSTGAKTPNVPGWKAYNDLWVATLPDLTGTRALTPGDIGTRQILTPSAPAPYAWWGSQFDWAPDGRTVGYALANQVGLIEIETGLRRPLKEFAYYRTRADWVWTPSLTWSPDSRFVAAAIHMPPEGVGTFEDSVLFDIGALARDNTLRLSLARNVGMWAAPLWSPATAQGESRIAFGQALNTADTERSRYALAVMDRDGSNRRQLYPAPGSSDEGLDALRLAWSPDGQQLAAIRDGDVWIYDFALQRWWQITANGNTKWVRWK